MIYHLYTDGSHFKGIGSGRLGIGGILVDPKKNQDLDSFGLEINREYLRIHYDTTDCSNPTMELLAALVGIREYKKYLGNPSDKLIVFADYEGVSKWMGGQWKTGKPYIARIYQEIKEEISGFNVSFQWIPGHQKVVSLEETPDAYWNNRVDKLAKGEK